MPCCTLDTTPRIVVQMSHGLSREEILELIRQESERSNRDRSIECELPKAIIQDLEGSSKKEIRTNVKRFAKDTVNYSGGSWTQSGALNKFVVQEIKHTKVDTYTSIQQRIKDGDKLRTAGKNAAEIYEELHFLIERGGGEDDADLLEQLLEKTRRLAVYAFASGKEIDAEAKETALKAIRLPNAVRHIDEEDDEKDMLFSTEEIERIQQARVEEAIINRSRHGNGNRPFREQRNPRGNLQNKKRFAWGGKPSHPGQHQPQQSQHHHQQSGPRSSHQ